MSVYVCAFMMNAGQVIFWLALPYLAMDWFDAGPATLGILAGVWWGVYVPTCLLAGWFAGRLSRVRTIAIGTGLIAAVSALVSTAQSVDWLLALSAVHAFGNAMFWPALEAQFSAGVGSTELRHRVGLFNLSWSSGDVLGALAGGSVYSAATWLVSRSGVSWLQATPFFVAGLLSLAVLATAALRLRHDAPRQSWRDEHDHKVPKSPGRGGGAALAVFWTMALIANAAAIAWRGVLIGLFPDIGKGVYGYSAWRWGLLLAMLPLCRTLMFAWWQRHEGWAYRARYLFGFQLLLPVAALLVVFGTSYWVFLLAFALSGIAMSKTYVGSIYYSLDSDHAHEHRGGMHEAALGAGSAVAPPIAGGIARASGWNRSPYLFSFVLLCAGIVVQLSLYLKRIRRAAG